MKLYRLGVDEIPEVLDEQTVIWSFCVGAEGEEAVVQCTNRLSAVLLARKLQRVLPGIGAAESEREDKAAAGEWEAFHITLPEAPDEKLIGKMEREIRRICTNFTYIVICTDGTLYTGWTNDLKKRMAAHQNGSGCKYTKSHGFDRLGYAEEHLTKQKAMQREWEIKHLSRPNKQFLIKGWTNGDK